MIITLRFLRIGSTAPEEMELSGVEYFDPLEADETYEKDGVPKFNNAWQYLNLDPADLSWSQLTIQGSGNVKRFSAEYFSEGKATAIHRKDSDGWEEIITTTQLHPHQTHILRLHRVGEVWRQNTNVLITTHPDGTQSETRFHGQVQKSEMNQFPSK